LASFNNRLSSLETNSKLLDVGCGTAEQVVTNDELWDRVRALEGSLVPASTGRRTFYVVSVSTDVAVLRVPKRYEVRRSTLEAAYALGRSSNALLPREISQARFDGVDPTLLIGLLNAIGADRE